MAQSLGSLLINVEANTAQLVQGFNKAESVVNKATKSMGTAIKSLAAAYVSLEAVDLAKSYAKQVDELTTVNNRLKLVTKSTQEFKTAQTELYKIAQDTRTVFAGTIDIFTRIARGTQNLNLSQKELLDLTTSINQAMRVGGGTAESQQAALIQLGQAFSSNFKAVGQELGSLREQAPRLYEAIVNGVLATNKEFKTLVDKGQEATGVFRKWAEEGKLSNKIIIDGLKSQGIVIGSEFKQMTMTIDEAMTTAKTSTQNFIYEFDKITGISQSVSTSIKDISSSIDNLSPEEIANLTEYIKNAAIAVGGGLIALKALNAGYSTYKAVVEDINKSNQLNIDIENSKAKAYSDGMKAVYARKIADEALNTGMLNGVEISKKKVTQLQKEAVSLENAAKKSQAYSYSLEGTAKSFNLASIGASAFRTVLTTIPFMAISIGISAIATSILQTSKNAEILNETLKATDEQLSKLTKNQLNYRQSLLETELATLRLEVANAKADTASKGIFETDEEHKKDLAYKDETIAKFEETRKTLVKIKELQKDINKPTVTTKTDSNVSNIATPRNDVEVLKLIGSQREKQLQQLEETIKKAKELGATEKEINSFREAELKRINELELKSQKDNKKTQDEKQQDLINYYEKTKQYSLQWSETEKKIREDNKTLTKQQLDELLLIEKENFDKKTELYIENQKKLEKQNDLITQATQLIADPIDTINDKYMEMYNVIDGLFNEEQMQKFFKKWQDEVDKTIKKQEEYEGLGSKEWASNLKGQAKNIADVSNAFEDINKEQKQWEKFSKDNLATEKDKATHVNEQLKGYSNLAGAISGIFEEGSREAAVFQTAQMALALVEGTRAVLSAGTGDPYTAIPRMIAMGAMVSSLLGNIGVAFGMNTTSTTSDSFSSESANIGAGSVLGDTSKESESINNALSTLEDFAQPQYQTLLSMNNYLETIANNIGGVTSLLIRQGGFAFGEGYEGFDTGFKNNISLNDITLGLMNPINSIISKIPIIGQVNGLLGGIVNSVLGGVFGKTSVSQSMTDSGIYFADQLLTQAIEDFNGSAYQTIQTTVTKKSWFSKSSSTTINSYFQALDEETERQFSLVLDNLYSTVLVAGQALDSTQSQIENSLSSFVVSLGKISLKDKTGDEIQETLTAAFGEIGDDIAKTAFPLLTAFQQIGEGMFETLTRVASGMEEAEFYISRLGNAFDDLSYSQIINKQGDIGFEALLQSITAVEKATYPTNNGLLDIVENLDATAEELYTVYISLDELRDRLLFLGQVAQGLSSSMIYGAGSVEALNSGFNAFFENFLTDSEQLTYQTQQITDEFNKLGLALPITKDSFKELLQSLDLTSESGQELYGRLIILSESFADVADKTAESITALEDELKTLTDTGFDDFISSFEGIYNAISSLKDIATSFINSFSTSSLGNTREQIIQYNKLRKQFEGMFDSTGKLNANVTEKEAKDIYSKLSGLGTAIGKSQEDLQKDLVSQFEIDLSKLDMSEEILKVDIVSGLGDLLGLSESQKSELQNIAKDGNITKDELNSIRGLTETQKNGILDFAKNSSLFSTEETLTYLMEYSKLQLELLKQSQAEETEGLSSKTFSYGDYIGKQEQIDIAKKLGVSYETAQPLIEQLQGLSVSKNLQSDVNSLLGYTGTSYNATTANQIESLSPYLSADILRATDNTKSTASYNLATQQAAEAEAERQRIIFENARADFNNRYGIAKENLNIESAQSADAWGGIYYHINKNYRAGLASDDISKPSAATHSSINLNAPYYKWKYDPYVKEHNEAYNAYNYVKALEQEKQIKGYAVGAVNIPNDQIAQIHQKEMIIPATFAEGLRNGDLTLSANTPNINLGNINLFEGVQDIMENIYKSLDDFPKKTFDLLDDVINGRSSVRVEQI